jgi:hypothetical protein
MSNINEIVPHLESASTTSRRIIQKYIERPLLIYNTKFDIRQWFVITSTNPLVIWLYCDVYLRYLVAPRILPWQVVLEREKVGEREGGRGRWRERERGKKIEKEREMEGDGRRGREIKKGRERKK